MKSKYLIGLIPSFFILMIACFADAAPVQGNQNADIITNCYTPEIFLKISTTPHR